MVFDELNVQADVAGEPQAIDTFHMEMLQQQGLMVFGFMQPKDMIIYLLHSPAPFYARGATTPLKGKNIGLVGDCTDFSNPTPVILQPEHPCKFPWLILLPSNLVKFCAETPMTPLELLKCVNRILTDDTL